MPRTVPSRIASALAGVVALVVALSGCVLLEQDPASPDVPRIEQDEELGELTVYEVDTAGELVPAASGLDAEVWDLFRRVVTPAYAAERILWYQVGDDPDSDLLAWVVESEEDPELWNLAVNLSAAEDEDLLLLTLIHEYAHLLSMGPGQTDESGDCFARPSSAPCAEDGSYLAAFHARFWASYGEEAPAYQEADDAVTADFYAEHEEEFVSEYAATNVGEDFAEVFTAFVAEPRPSDPGDSLVAAKIAFMWEWPELVEIRERLRSEFGDIAWVEF